MGEWRVAGQLGVVRVLQGAIERRRVGHAYFFVGPAGCGKTAVARTFAQALNCESADSPCYRCQTCARIAAGQDFKVEEIKLDESRREINIDQVRTIGHRASLKSTGSGYRITIIPRAELFSNAAANAFLKLLEEPPPNSMFMLAAPSRESVPETLASRCIVIQMGMPTRAAIAELLLEGPSVPESDRTLILKYAEGRSEWAIDMAGDPEKLEEFKALLKVVVGCLGEHSSARIGIAQKLGRHRAMVLEYLRLLASYHAVVGRSKAVEQGMCSSDSMECVAFYRTWVSNLMKIRESIDALSANAMLASTLDNLFLDLDEIADADLPAS